MIHRIALTLFVAVTLSACEQSIAPVKLDKANTPAPNGIEWTELGDGSFIASIGPTEISSNITIRRCWKVKEAFDCLIVDRRSTTPQGEAAGENDGMFLASRYREADLKFGHERREVGGYSCEVYGSGGMVENVANETGYIATNRVQLIEGTVQGILLPANGEAWTEETKRRLLNENDIETEARPFDCEMLARAVLGAGIGTVGSTELTQEVIQ